MKDFNFRLKKDMTNNGGQTLKKGEIVIITDIYCNSPFNSPRCSIKKDDVLIYTTLKDLFK